MSEIVTSNTDANLSRNAFTYEDLLNCAHGELFGQGNARLPLPPMLMFDRIVKIVKDGGDHGAGQMIAEFDIKPDLWFFKCHFEQDPVMPGCLGLDALWQMLGFFLGWLGLPGPGRALSVGEVKFSGEVVPSGKLLRYHLNVKRVIKRAFTLGVADGYAELDGEKVYGVSGMRVGLFPQGRDAG
ncbi:MAG: bifunctional 3-hydroxydecanoyl-ACP dehydratase/trans-2-decenoyl-ACP isomerase [Alphaproteobacteria bacterium]|nr:bifunctional 3-hydroxydecanoyl-ACP dehydratase/trans-2-decenoyl-ACP isomerase [Alphaproteobacteria bacterium]